jgi:hypothetical protein
MGIVKSSAFLLLPPPVVHPLRTFRLSKGINLCQEGLASELGCARKTIIEIESWQSGVSRRFLEKFQERFPGARVSLDHPKILFQPRNGLFEAARRLNAALKGCEPVSRIRSLRREFDRQQQMARASFDHSFVRDDAGNLPGVVIVTFSDSRRRQRRRRSRGNISVKSAERPRGGPRRL